MTDSENQGSEERSFWTTLPGLIPRRLHTGRRPRTRLRRPPRHRWHRQRHVPARRERRRRRSRRRLMATTGLIGAVGALLLILFQIGVIGPDEPPQSNPPPAAETTAETPEDSTSTASEGAKPPPPEDLSSNIPQRVGNHTLQEANTYPNSDGATERLEFIYQSQAGEQILLDVWDYPSTDSADQGGAALISQLQAQGYSSVEIFPVQDAQGNQLGTGVLLQGLEDEILIWNNENVLARVESPHGSSPDFYDALPI
jgi:hypothetical protein